MSAGATDTGTDYVEVAADDELWDGEMESYEVGDTEVLVVKIDGTHHAFHGICPHQSVALVEGELDGTTLTCRGHEWSFDVTTGSGINPRGYCLVRHGVEIRDGAVLVSRRPLPAEGADVSGGSTTS